jgi:hypothetical protein
LLEKKKKEEKEAINKLKRFLPNRIRPPKISLFEKKKKKKKKLNHNLKWFGKIKRSMISSLKTL